MSRPERCSTGASERGDVMVMSLVLLTAALVAITVLVSASEQWEARRKAAAAAATMARAAAQGDPAVIREGGSVSIDPAAAQMRLNDVLDALALDDRTSEYQGRITALDGLAVTTEASVSVDYTFPIPGFPARATGSATAEAVLGDRAGS